MEDKNKNPSKKQIAYEHLRKLILDGTYGSGQRIIIDQTAKELSLSPIPVREESDNLNLTALFNISLIVEQWLQA